MSKEILTHIHSHKSIRKYKSDPVPEAVLNRILEASLRGSSSGNMQSFSVIVTADAQKKQELFKPHFEQAMVLEAPLILTFCSDFHRMREWLKLRGARDNFTNYFSFMIGAIDAVIAAQNAALAAEAEGLGICYMGTTLASSEQIGSILKCPSNVVPVTGFVMGYPNESPALRDRLPLKGIVHRESYRDYSADEINEIYRDRDQKGWDRYMSIPELKEQVLKAGCENLAQIYTQVKYTQESHEEYSRLLKEYLDKQNYFK